MKRGIILLLVLFLFCGCSFKNTPSGVVEELLMKYQNVDKDIKNEINEMLNEDNLTDSQKERYYNLLDKQYRNLSYEIKDEKIDGDEAVVDVEIEVLDYKKEIKDLVFDSSIYTKESYEEERLNRLENSHDLVKYTISFGLKKNDLGEWKLMALSNEDLKKLQGMF